MDKQNETVVKTKWNAAELNQKPVRLFNSKDKDIASSWGGWILARQRLGDQPKESDGFNRLVITLQFSERGTPPDHLIDVVVTQMMADSLSKEQENAQEIFHCLQHRRDCI